MKQFILLLFSLVLTLVSCNKQDLPNDTPSCIGDKIEDNLYKVEILEKKKKKGEKRKIINSTLKIIDYGKKK